MVQISWSDEMYTGIAPLDDLHRDLFAAMSEARSMTNEEFVDYYSALVSKVEHAFINEEQWMENIDSDLLKIHREQHAGVLGALHHVHRRVLEDDVELGRRVVEDLLPKWYAFHISTMDTVLAIALEERNIQITSAPAKPSGIYIN